MEIHSAKISLGIWLDLAAHCLENYQIISAGANCVTFAFFSANAGGLGTIVVSLARKETEGHRRSAHSATRERFFCFSHRGIWLS